MQRPEKYLGDIETWDKAEAALSEALNEFGRPWQVLNTLKLIDNLLQIIIVNTIKALECATCYALYFGIKIVILDSHATIIMDF